MSPRARPVPGNLRLTRIRDGLLRRRNELAARLAATGSPSSPPPHIVGRVDVLQRERIEGFIVLPPAAPLLQASIYINEVEATSTWAVPTEEEHQDGQVHRFRFALYDLWRFAKRTDRITVRVAGHPLPLSRQGSVYYPRRNGKESLDQLRQRFADGHVFAQNGMIQLSRSVDTDWQDQVFRLYDEVGALIESQFGYRTFLYNGTLLGQVRENGFIGHDLDFDAAYLSRHTTGPAAATELFEIGAALIEAGYQVIPKSSCMAIKDPASGVAQIDLFHLYRIKERIAFPFGSVGTDEVSIEGFGDIVETDFIGRRVAVPEHAETVVAHLYGSHWARPTPGFSWVKDRRTRDVGLLDLNRQDVLYWRSFYGEDHTFGPSAFAHSLLERPDRPATIVDLGCGDGRDSYLLAEAGHRVIGLDRVTAALNLARARGQDAAGGPTFQLCDFSRASELADLITEIRGLDQDAPILFYARFLLHSLPEATQRKLLDVLTDSGRPGDWFAAELRTDLDQPLKKTFFRSYRRFQPADDLLAELTDRHGLNVVDTVQGTGLAPLEGEDPEVLRVFAVRGRADDRDGGVSAKSLQD